MRPERQLSALAEPRPRFAHGQWLLCTAAAIAAVAVTPALAVVYYEVDSLPAPTRATQMIYAPAHNRLILRNSASAVATVDLVTRTATYHLSNAGFTDITASPSRNFVFVADYGGENIGYGTPNATSYVHRLNLLTGVWDVESVYIAGQVEPISDTQFVLKSNDQWVTFTNNLWSGGSAATQLGSPFYASAYFGDFRYHVPSGRILHGGSGSSSQEIRAYSLVNNAFALQESSGTYGSAQGYGGTVEMAIDGSAFYYGKLQVDPLNVGHNLRAFPELIFAATGDIALSNGNYYDAHTGLLKGNLGLQTQVYGLNPNGQDFWAYDAANNLLRRFATSPPPPGDCTLAGNRVSVLSIGAISDSATAIVQNGTVEFAPAPGNPNISIDVEGATLRIANDSPNVFTFTVPTTYSMMLAAGSPITITGASTEFNVVSGAPSVSFNGQAVNVNVTGSTWQPGDNITVTMRTLCAKCSLDVDGNGAIDALTDGILLMRALFGLTGASVTNNAVAPNATRTSWPMIRSYLNNSCGGAFAP